jgi:large subunit ribosomal protein L18
MTSKLNAHRLARKTRVRAKLKHLSNRPRLHVFRSNKHIYAQVIDDQNGQTLAASSESAATATSKTKTERALEVGLDIAAKALKKKVSQVSFDRGPYKFHGRIKALAEAARKGGLKF